MKVYLLLAAFAAVGSAQLLPPGLPQASAPPAASSEPIKDDTVVANIAGVSVTAGDVGKLMGHAPQNLQQLFKMNPQMAVGTAYQMKYLAQEAEKAHLDQQQPTKDDLEAAIEWQKTLILASALVTQVNNSPVTQEQIDEFYKTHQSRYESANIKIILLGFKPAPLKTDLKGDTKEESIDEKLKDAAKNAYEGEHPLNDRSEAEAHALAEDIIKQLRAGAKFEDLAKKYSDDKESKDSGGDFGTPIKSTSSFAPEIKKVVFDLKVGEVSEPLRQGNSYYVIRLESKSAQPLVEVGSAIAKEIRDTRMNDYINDVNKRFTPQVIRPDFFILAQKAVSGQAAQPSQAPAGAAPGAH